MVSSTLLNGYFALDSVWTVEYSESVSCSQLMLRGRISVFVQVSFMLSKYAEIYCSDNNTIVVM